MYVFTFFSYYFNDSSVIFCYRLYQYGSIALNTDADIVKKFPKIRSCHCSSRSVVYIAAVHENVLKTKTWIRQQ